MGQKFFDILPPKKSSPAAAAPSVPAERPKPKKEDLVLDVPPKKPYADYSQYVEEKIEDKPAIPTEASAKNPSPVKKGRALKIILGLAVLVVLVLGAASVASFVSKTKVEIWPKISSFAMADEFVIDPAQKSADFSTKILPGQVFADETSFAQSFQATGKAVREVKAKGVIQVYNNFSSTPQILASGTRFVSSDGKIFKAINRVVIPGATSDSKGKLVPNSLNVDVQSAQAGEDYNIGPSTFSIPGFAGTPKFTAFYGKSFSAMTGGFKGEGPQLTQNDLDQAQATLAAKIKVDSQNSIKNKNSADFILLPGSLTQQIENSSSSQKAGALVDGFTCQAKIKTTWVGFRRADIDSLIKSSVGLKNKIKDASLQTDFTIKNLDANTGKINLTVSIKAQIYPDINIADLEKTFLGKNIAEAKAFLEGQPEVSKAKISSLFWVTKIPADAKKLDIKLNLD